MIGRKIQKATIITVIINLFFVAFLFLFLLLIEAEEDTIFILFTLATLTLVAFVKREFDNIAKIITFYQLGGKTRKQNRTIMQSLIVGTALIQMTGLFFTIMEKGSF